MYEQTVPAPERGSGVAALAELDTQIIGLSRERTSVAIQSW